MRLLIPRFCCMITYPEHTAAPFALQPRLSLSPSYSVPVIEDIFSACHKFDEGCPDRIGIIPDPCKHGNILNGLIRADESYE